MSIPEALVAALSDRYTIERELGRGGMATGRFVSRADEPGLGGVELSRASLKDASRRLTTRLGRARPHQGATPNSNG
jgi:hypothetical protein